MDTQNIPNEAGNSFRFACRGTGDVKGNPEEKVRRGNREPSHQTTARATLSAENGKVK